MPNWITDSQDEQSLEELFRDADQVHVPVFQRSYIWARPQFDQLRRDIELIRDDIERSQFLGAVVAYERERVREVVGRLRALDVVDGQQRLLTLYILVMALVEQIAGCDKEIAAEIVQEFLLLPQRRGLDTNTRIVPAYNDRHQFKVLWDRIAAPDVLGTELGENTPLPPAPSGEIEGNLTKQYQRILRYVREGLPGDSAERLGVLRRLLEIVTRRLTFVHLKLTDASVATKIFERLNYRGVRVEIVDLVRNEVFSRVDSEPQAALHVYQHQWLPFEQSFQGHAEAFFFPYCLIHDANTKKSELFTELRKMWGGRDPDGIMAHMAPFRAPFLAVEMGTDHYPDEVESRLRGLIRMRRPSSIYPFVMSLLHSYETGATPECTVATTLDVLESFLVRRAISGLEPTGLHAVFKGLWADVRSDLTPAAIYERITARTTIEWPNDAEIEMAVYSHPIGKARICNYLLVEYDRSYPGDTPADIPTIEHVLPKNYNDEWATSFTREEHKTLVDTWANLLPLSSTQNPSLQDSSYAAKRPRYLAESMFTSTRRFAETFQEWTPTSMHVRAGQIAEWVKGRWPYGG